MSCFSFILDSPEIMNINQSSSSLSRPSNDPLHEQRIIKEDSHIERSVPESYHHSSYEYLSSGIGGGGNNNNQYPSPTNMSSHHQTSSPSQKYPNKYVTSSSYSPTSYRYPPASLIDESPLSTYSINRPIPQQQPPQQLSTSSLSAYVPQHNNNHNNTNINRHSLLPTTSDDSGNESSINYHQQITNNTHFVVVAIDFGTTFSGYAFAFTRDIDSILMMRKVDGNDPGSFRFFVFFSLSIFIFISFSFNRCNQSKNANDNTFNTKFRISFIWFFCSRFFS
jgi:hypothetical protein